MGVKLKMYSGKDEPKHCTSCGRKLNKKKIRWGFSQANGEPKFGTELTCSSFIGYLFHDSYKFNPDGYEVISFY